MSEDINQDALLNGLSSSNKDPKAYQQMLERLPEDVKRTFVEMPAGAIREYAQRHMRNKLKENPGFEKLLDADSIRQITKRIENNILEDQATVRQALERSARNDRYRVVTR